MRRHALCVSTVVELLSHFGRLLDSSLPDDRADQ